MTEHFSAEQLIPKMDEVGAYLVEHWRISKARGQTFQELWQILPFQGGSDANRDNVAEVML